MISSILLGGQRSAETFGISLISYAKPLNCIAIAKFSLCFCVVALLTPVGVCVCPHGASIHVSSLKNQLTVSCNKAAVSETLMRFKNAAFSVTPLERNNRPLIWNEEKREKMMMTNLIKMRMQSAEEKQSGGMFSIRSCSQQKMSVR